MSALVMCWLASLQVQSSIRPTRAVWPAPGVAVGMGDAGGEVGLTSAPVSIDTDVDRTVNQDSWIAWHPHAPVDEDVIVVGEAVFAIEPLSESTIDACRRLAFALPFTHSRSRFLCATCGESPQLVGATPLPDLRAGGTELIEALATALKRERASS